MKFLKILTVPLNGKRPSRLVRESTKSKVKQSVPEIVVSSTSFDLSVTDFSDSTTIYVDGRQYMGTMKHMTGSFRIDARAENGATLHRFVDIDFAVPNGGNA